MAHSESNTMSATTHLWGVMAEFDNPGVLSKAAEAVRDAGYKKWDVYSPFPVHGMDHAMGAPASKVPWVMGAMALTGFSGAMAMQWWMSSVDYQIVTGGKPLFAWEQFTPILFELSVLLAAFGAVFGMLILNLLPRWHHPLFAKERFLRVSDDRFIIVIESCDPKFDSAGASRLLESLGGRHVDVVEDLS